MSIFVTLNLYATKFKVVILKYFELFVLITFLILCMVCIFVFKMPLLIPTNGQAKFFSIHYVYPLIIAVVCQFILIFFYKLFKRKNAGISIRENLISLLYIPFIALVMFLHFQLKAWAPLVNPNTYDAVYLKLDNLTPIANWLSAAGKTLDPAGIFCSLYFWLFFLIFALSFVLHSAFDDFRNLRKVVVGTCLVLLLGGISYWIAPALGPFIFENSKLAGFPETQKNMYEMYQSIIATGKIPDSYFGAALAAMPSLHIANSLFLLLCAKRSLKWLLILYIPIFVFFVIVAVASKYHYVIDLVFGALLSVFVYWLVNKIYD